LSAFDRESDLRQRRTRGSLFLKIQKDSNHTRPDVKASEVKGSQEGGWEYAEGAKGIDKGTRGGSGAGWRAGVRFSDKGRGARVVARGIVALYPPQPAASTKGLPTLARGRRRKHFAARTGSAVVCRFPGDPRRERTSWLFQLVRLASDSCNSTELPAISGDGSPVFQAGHSTGYRGIFSRVWNVGELKLNQIKVTV